MSNVFNSMGIDVGIVIILLMIISIVLIVMMMINFNTTKRLQRQYKSFMKGMDGASLEKLFHKRLQQIDRMANTQDQQDTEMQLLHVVQDRALTKYGIVKYDAFEDVGGKLSFVLALLDKNNSGIVLNAIHSKENCFLYIKEIVKGESYIMLSNEEIEALRNAEKFGDGDDILAGLKNDKI
ncbi:MAG: DUF4446 family protein [Lachnospiraceae bacterium]|jgi:hypothetical protein|nr:DUF4446 family protein [Lachnospiraceae bacterium]